MPHVVLEYSDDLSPLPDLHVVFSDVHAALESITGASRANAKSRATGVESYVGDGDVGNAFVHLDIRLMEGRSQAVKRELSDRCLDIVVGAFTDAGKGRNLQCTVAVSDLKRATYAKHPPGTIPAG